MLRDQVLALLKAGDAPCSGEGMSRTLGVSRAAVWKAVEALRQEGYVISSAPHRGYRLEDSPDLLSPGELAGALAGGLCSQYFTRSLLPALLLSLMALLLCELPVWALRCYLGHAPISALLRVVLPETVYSLLYTPLLYLLSWRISLTRRS